jgi:hypothetical protein
MILHAYTAPQRDLLTGWDNGQKVVAAVQDSLPSALAARQRGK